MGPKPPSNSNCSSWEANLHPQSVLPCCRAGNSRVCGRLSGPNAHALLRDTALCRGYVLFLTYKVVLLEHGSTEDVWKVRQQPVLTLFLHL